MFILQKYRLCLGGCYKYIVERDQNSFRNVQWDKSEASENENQVMIHCCCAFL